MDQHRKSNAIFIVRQVDAGCNPLKCLSVSIGSSEFSGCAFQFNRYKIDMVLLTT